MLGFCVEGLGMPWIWFERFFFEWFGGEINEVEVVLGSCYHGAMVIF